MRICYTVIMGLLFAQSGLASSTMVGARFDYGSVFREELYLSATHMFTDNIGVGAMIDTFPQVKTLEFDIGPLFSFCGLFVAPGVGVTFGPSSWTFSNDKTERLGRDIAPYLALFYQNDMFDAEGFTEFYFPLQESSDTAVEFGIMRFWGAIKWNNLGVGPFIQPLFTKNSGGSMQLSHLPVGGVLVANFEKLTLRLFLGHDPIVLDNWLGFPKVAQPFFKAMGIYRF